MSVRSVEAVVRPRRYPFAPRAPRFSVAPWQQEIPAECSRYPRSPILFQVNQPRVLLPFCLATSAPCFPGRRGQTDTSKSETARLPREKLVTGLRKRKGFLFL